MPVTSFHQPTGLYLTSFGADAKAGDIHTISLGSTSKTKRHGWANPTDGRGHPQSCEFTTYLLGEPVAHDKWGPLFDLGTCANACPLDYSEATPETIRALHALPALSRYPDVVAA